MTYTLEWHCTIQNVLYKVQAKKLKTVFFCWERRKYSILFFVENRTTLCAYLHICTLLRSAQRMCQWYLYYARHWQTVFQRELTDPIVAELKSGTNEKFRIFNKLIIILSRYILGAFLIPDWIHVLVLSFNDIGAEVLYDHFSFR